MINTFQIAHVEGVLRAQIHRMCRLAFAAEFVIVRLLLQSCDLSAGKHDAFSGNLFLKRLQPFTEVLQVVPLPDGANPAVGDKHAFLRSSLLVLCCPWAGMLTRLRVMTGLREPSSLAFYCHFALS
jgi:hypothetical protein